MKWSKLYTLLKFAPNEDQVNPKQEDQTIGVGDTVRLNAFFHFEDDNADFDAMVFGPYIEGVVKEFIRLSPDFVRYTLDIENPALPGMKAGTHELMFDHVIDDDGACVPPPTLIEDGEVPDHVLEGWGLLERLQSGQIIAP